MELNDMPYLLLGALASVRDDSINTVEDMVSKGKELAEGTKAKVKASVQDKKLDATIQELVKKGKKESDELVDAIGKVVKETLDSLGDRDEVRHQGRREEAGHPGEEALGPAREEGCEEAAARRRPPRRSPRPRRRPRRKHSCPVRRRENPWWWRHGFFPAIPAGVGDP